MHAIKYVLYLHLCRGGCVFNMFGMDCGLVSMSLLLSNCSELKIK